MAMVTTIIGEVDEAELTRETVAKDEGNVITMGYEWIYKGNDPQKLALIEAARAVAVAQHPAIANFPPLMVRRDAWVVIKSGHSATGAAGQSG